MYFDPKKKGSELRGERSGRKGKGKKNFRKKRTPYNVDPDNPQHVLVQVFKDTQGYIKQSFLPKLLGRNPEQESYLLTIQEINDKFAETDLKTLIEHKVEVTVANECTVVGAYNMRKRHEKVLVLNLASDFVPGGGVKKGRAAQEEELFRRTTYSMFLNPRNRDDFYPLRQDQMIQTEGVTIIKNLDYTIIPEDEQIDVDFLALAAIRKPAKVVTKGCERYYDRKDYELMRAKIESIFKLGVIEGYDALVLGAIGCGCFQNPVHDVRDIFAKCVSKYGKYFKEIRFNILSRSGNNNFELFRTIRNKKFDFNLF